MKNCKAPPLSFQNRGRPDLQKEVQDAEEPEAGRYSGWEH